MKTNYDLWLEKKISRIEHSIQIMQLNLLYYKETQRRVDNRLKVWDVKPTTAKIEQITMNFGT